MRSLKARDGIPSQGGRTEREPRRRPFLKRALLAAGIAAAAVALLWDEIPGKNPAGRAPETQIAEMQTPKGPKLNPVANSPHIRKPTPRRKNLPWHPSESDSSSPVVEESMRTKMLSWTFDYSNLDCQMLPAAEVRNTMMPEGVQFGELAEYLSKLHDGTDFHRASLSASYYNIALLEYSYDKTDVWNVLPFVRYLDSLGLESGSTTLFDEYAKMWIEGGADAMLPDPNCMERIAEAVSLLRMARNDLSELLGKDPSMAPEVLGSLSEPARRIVLSGAVGVALADAERPNIEDLFDFLTAEDKIALIKMYDSSLPDSERLSVVRVQSLPSLPESGLWNLLSDRMDRFKDYSYERKESSHEPAASGK